MIKKVFTAVYIAVFFFSNNSPAAEGVDRGELLASMCITCHGPDAQGSKRIPALNHHTAQELTEYMYGFKDGSETATIMDRHAGAYNDEEIKLITNYFYEAQQ